MSFQRIGVLGAMSSEIAALVGHMEVSSEERGPAFDTWQGRLFGRDCVVARCGMGKVAAAAGVQRLLDRHGVDCIVVCGLAGGLRDGLRLGDVVVGESFLQHDLDASPIFPRYHVPGMGVDYFQAPPQLVAVAEAAAQAFLNDGLAEFVAAEDLRRLGIEQPRLLRGLIVTGDQFVKDSGRERLQSELPDALCVEMEGGAIAQVCHLNQAPFAIIRIISDNADRDAPADFMRFVEVVAPAYVLGIMRELLRRLP